MIDFKQELNKLLDLETKQLPGDDLVEAALAGKQILASLNKKQSEIALQVEEIYDLVGNIETNALQEALQSEKKRANALADAIVALSDVLEDFCAFATASGDEELDKQGQMMWNNSAALLERNGFIRLGKEGQALDPSVHTVQALACSDYPKEQVARVLQSGYRYRGQVLRKAAVLLSNGEPEPPADAPPCETAPELPGEQFRFSVSLHCIRREEKKKVKKEKKEKKSFFHFLKKKTV